MSKRGEPEVVIGLETDGPLSLWPRTRKTPKFCRVLFFIFEKKKKTSGF